MGKQVTVKQNDRGRLILMVQDCNDLMDYLSLIEERTMLMLKKAEKAGVTVEQYNGENLMITLDELRGNIEAYLKSTKEDK